MAPIKIKIKERRAPQKTVWDQYQKDVSEWETVTLIGKPTAVLEGTLHNLTTDIHQATENNAPRIKYRTLRHPDLNEEIKTKVIM